MVTNYETRHIKPHLCGFFSRKLHLDNRLRTCGRISKAVSYSMPMALNNKLQSDKPMVEEGGWVEQGNLNTAQRQSER